MEERHEFMRPLSRLPRVILSAGLVAAAPGCVVPPAPQASFSPAPHPGSSAAHPPAKPIARSRIAKCEQPPRPLLTEAQKAALFHDFDNWVKERNPGAADTPVPPSPAAARPATTGRACRVSGA